MLERRPLTPELSVSLLGLGTVKLGRNQGVKYPQGFELPSDRQVDELLHTAQELGINLIDTAPAYGLAEQRLGQRLPGPRNSWVLGTKVGERFDGASHFDFTSKGARQSLDNSLRLLNTDYLDYVLLHSDGDDLAVLNSGACEQLIAAKQAGWIRAVGISSKTLDGAEQALALGLDIVMLTINPEYPDEIPAAAQAAQLQRGVLVKKAMGSGHLSPEKSLPWVAGTPGVSAIIAGTLNPDHLRANARTLGYKDT